MRAPEIPRNPHRVGKSPRVWLLATPHLVVYPPVESSPALLGTQPLSQKARTRSMASFLAEFQLRKIEGTDKNLMVSSYATVFGGMPLGGCWYHQFPRGPMAP